LCGYFSYVFSFYDIITRRVSFPEEEKKKTPGYIRIYTADTSIRKRKMADQQRQGAS
jgi:hypothetical protein